MPARSSLGKRVFFEQSIVYRQAVNTVLFRANQKLKNEVGIVNKLAVI
jgi:hypothetical protein